MPILQQLTLTTKYSSLFRNPGSSASAFSSERYLSENYRYHQIIDHEVIFQFTGQRIQTLLVKQNTATIIYRRSFIVCSPVGYVYQKGRLLICQQ